MESAICKHQPRGDKLGRSGRCNTLGRYHWSIIRYIRAVAAGRIDVRCYKDPANQTAKTT